MEVFCGTLSFLAEEWALQALVRVTNESTSRA